MKKLIVEIDDKLKKAVVLDSVKKGVNIKQYVIKALNEELKKWK
jgi:predicted HicB family RNase H-like nuclease